MSSTISVLQTGVQSTSNTEVDPNQIKIKKESSSGKIALIVLSTFAKVVAAVAIKEILSLGSIIGGPYGTLILASAFTVLLIATTSVIVIVKMWKERTAQHTAQIQTPMDSSALTKV